jgi:gluconate kinase
MYEIKLREIMENEILGSKFKWWNEASRSARRKRTKKISKQNILRRNDKLLCCSTFLKACKEQLKEELESIHFIHCFTGEMTEPIFLSYEMDRI